MEETAPSPHLVHFGVFEVDLRAGELRKSGTKLKFSGQPFQVLALLLGRPGDVVTREELQKRLWADGTFVDFDHNLNAAINKIREVLGDSAESPRFVETLPRRGYRFIAPVDSAAAVYDRRPEPTLAERPYSVAAVREPPLQARRRWPTFAAAMLGFATLTVGAILAYQRLHQPSPPPQRALTRLTFDPGLQSDPTFLPDGRMFAYSSDRSGNFDIWVQQIGGGDAVQVTKSPAHDWQPDWSPDGKQIVFRSERDGGGLYVIPALGGDEQKISSFGFRPRWSPDGSRILFRSTILRGVAEPLRVYIVGLDGNPPHEVLAGTLTGGTGRTRVAWHPDGQRVSMWLRELGEPQGGFWTVPVAGGAPVKSELAPQVEEQLKAASVFLGDFVWAPSGKALYFEGTSRGVRNLWKVTAEPNTLRWVAGPERLTTGPGQDTTLAVSMDGKKVAFVTRTESLRIWSIPFDAAKGRTTGEGQPVTASGADADLPDLTRDGGKLVFRRIRAGKESLWQKSLPDGRETLLFADSFERDFPRWSRDGARLAYPRRRPGTPPPATSIVVLPAGGGSEESLLSSLTYRCDNPCDWSADGKWMLVSTCGLPPGRAALWLLPLSGAPHAETEARVVASNPEYDLWQGRFSPDDRWICFMAEEPRTSRGPLMSCLPRAATGFPSRTENMTMTSRAGLRTARSFTSFLRAADSGTCGEGASIRRWASPLGSRSRLPGSKAPVGCLRTTFHTRS